MEYQYDWEISNFGNLWTYEDKQILLTEIINGKKNISDIAKILKRDNLGVRCQIEKIFRKHKLDTNDFIYEDNNNEYIKKNIPQDIENKIIEIKKNIKKGSNSMSSKKCVEWIEKIMEKENIYIQYSKNEGEYIIPGTRYTADGFCKETNTIYEFQGCFYHGCPLCFKDRMNNINNKTGKTYNELYEKTCKKNNIIKSMGYNLIEIWECKYDEMYRNKNKRLYRRRYGGPFNYYNKTHFDFRKYGIFKRQDFLNNENIYNDNCLYIALKQGGLSNEKLNQLKSICLTREVPLIRLNKICEKLNICIKLTYLKLKNKKDNKSQRDYKIYGNEYKEIYNIGLLDNHYFVLDDTSINSYCLKHYEDVKELKECNRICEFYNGRYKKKNRFIDSFKLVKLLLEYKDTLLQKIPYDDLEKTHYVKQVDNFDTLDYNEKECVKPIQEYVEYKEPFKKRFNKNEYDKNNKVSKILKKENEKNEYEKYLIVYADFETYKNLKTKYKHIPYLCCMYVEGYGLFSFIGHNCGKQMLDKLYKLNQLQKQLYNETDTVYNGIKMYFHNAKYDYCHISQFLTNENLIYRNGQFYQSKSKYYGVDIEIKDSHKLISSALKNFKKMFKLKVKKEIMPYELYDLRNPLENRYVELDECLKYIKDEDHNEFIENCKKFGCLRLIKSDGFVDIIKYSLKYCEMDCIVLYQGMNIFKKWMYEITGLNIHNVLTISSLAQNYLLTKSVFDDLEKTHYVKQVDNFDTLDYNEKECVKPIQEYVDYKNNKVSILNETFRNNILDFDITDKSGKKNYNSIFYETMYNEDDECPFCGIIYCSCGYYSI